MFRAVMKGSCPVYQPASGNNFSQNYCKLQVLNAVWMFCHKIKGDVLQLTLKNAEQCFVFNFSKLRFLELQSLFFWYSTCNIMSRSRQGEKYLSEFMMVIVGHWPAYIVVFWGMLQTLAYAEKISWGFSFSGTWWSFVLVCAVCDVTIWRHIHVSKPTFWRSLLT